MGAYGSPEHLDYIPDRRTCSKCGHEVVNSNFCPNCGAKLRSRPQAKAHRKSLFRTVLTVVVIFVLAAMVYGFKGGYPVPLGVMNAVPPRSDEIAAVSTASDLLSAYQDDSTAADRKYHNQTLKISGTVLTVADDPDGVLCVLLGSPYQQGQNAVQCYFDEDQLLQVSKLKPGDSLTIVGVCYGYTKNVFVKNSILYAQTAASEAIDSNAGLTLTQFNRIEIGMSYERVCELLGSGGTLFSSVETSGQKTEIYTWNSGTGLTYCSVSFQNGKVSEKAQVGLK